MLYLNNIPIPVPENFSVRLEWVNPLCYFDKIPGNAGLGIEIEVNEFTRAIFGNPERFEKYSNASARKFPGFAIRKNGVTMEAGALEITNANDKTYSAWLQTDFDVMREEQQDRFINELEWRKNITFQNKETYDPETDDYCTVLLRNEHFWEGKGAHGNVMVPFINEDGELDVREEYKNYLNEMFKNNSDYQVNYEAEPGQMYVLSPFLFFRYVLKEALRQTNFYIRSHPFDDIPGANDLTLYNNFSIVSPNPHTAIKSFWTFDFNLNQYVYVDQEVIDAENWGIQLFNYADLIPKISMKDFLLSTQNFLNVVFVPNPDRSIDIVDRETIFDSEPFDLTPYQVSSWRKLEKKKISLMFKSEYEPEDANFADEFHDLSDRWQDFKEPVDNLTQLFFTTNPSNPNNDRSLGQLRYVRDENKIYEFKWTVFNQKNSNGTEEQWNVLAWEFVSSGPQFYTYRNGDEIEEINTKISTLQMEDGTLSARQRGNIAAMRSMWKDFTYRMFYYLGGTDGNVDHATAQTSCNWEGENGIFNRRWKKTARWWANREKLEAEFNLPLNVLNYIKRNMAKQKFRTEKGEFIVEKIQVDAGLNKLGMATLTVFKA